MEPGQKYGELTIIELLPGGRVRCLCSCGVEKTALKRNVKSGATRSCGHLFLESSRRNIRKAVDAKKDVSL